MSSGRIRSLHIRFWTSLYLTGLTRSSVRSSQLCVRSQQWNTRLIPNPTDSWGPLFSFPNWQPPFVLTLYLSSWAHSRTTLNLSKSSQPAVPFCTPQPSAATLAAAPILRATGVHRRALALARHHYCQPRSHHTRVPHFCASAWPCLCSPQLRLTVHHHGKLLLHRSSSFLFTPTTSRVLFPASKHLSVDSIGCCIST